MSFLIKYLDQQWTYNEDEKTLKNKGGDWTLQTNKWNLPKEGDIGYILDESTNNVLGLQHCENSENKNPENWKSRTVVALEDVLAG